MENTTNCMYYTYASCFVCASADVCILVSGPEIRRLKKRFMKLDTNGSGSIEKEEFLQIPTVANNPLALRLISIFDEK